MKRFKTLFIVLAIVGIAVLIKLLYLSPKKEMGIKGTTGGGRKPPSVVSVFIANPSILENSITTTGSLLSNEEADLKPEVSGKITYLKINEGAYISKGTLLVKINDADLQAQLKKLNLQLSLAEEKEKRLQKLLAINGVSKEEHDISLNQVVVIKAEVEFMNAQLAKTEIRAPFNGTLGIKLVSEGAYVTPANTIVTIQQINPIKLDFSIPEKYAREVKNGSKITFTIQGMEETFKATVFAIEPKIALETRTIQLRALANNPKNNLFPGAFSQITIPLSKNTTSIMIPTEAIIPILKGQKVFIYKSGIAKEQLVETGVRNASSIEIVKGISAGDTLIVKGLMTIKDGSTLKISSGL